MREKWRLFRREREDPEPFYSLLAREAAADLDRRYGPLRGQRVLDLGCGPGYYTAALRAVGAEVTPVDNSEEELALAGMSGSADRPKLHFEVRKDSAPVDPIGFLE